MSFPSPPWTVPAGQNVLWTVPTSTTNGTEFVPGMPIDAPGCTSEYEGEATSSLSGGYFFLNGSKSLGWPVVWATWSGFKVPFMPPGTVIENVYPVAVVNGVQSENDHQYYGGPDIDPSNALYSPGLLRYFDGTYSGEFSGLTSTVTMGNTEAAITGTSVGFCMWNSANGCGYPDECTFTFVGLAVYVTLPTSNKFPVISVSVGNTQPLG